MENQHLETLLKQDKNQFQGTKKLKIWKTKYEFWNSLKPTASPETIKKNAQTASISGGQATNNTEIINVRTFIQKKVQ